MSLVEQKCTPCEGGATPLKGQDLEKPYSQLDGWDVVDEHHLKKEFGFKDFKETLDFVNKVGAVAEAENHHPNITFTWGKAQIQIYTHNIDGLSMNDFILAAKIDQL